MKISDNEMVKVKWLVIIGTTMQFLLTIWFLSQMINKSMATVFVLCVVLFMIYTERQKDDLAKTRTWAAILVTNLMVMYLTIAVVAYAQWSIAKSGGF